MISGSAALTGSTQTRTTLSYVNNLVTGATSSGSYQVFISNEYMDDDMMDVLIGTYGFNVTKRTHLMGSNTDYIVKWEPNPPQPSVTPTPTTTITPTVTPTVTVTPTKSVTPTVTPTNTVTPTKTVTVTPTRSVTPTPSVTTSSAPVGGSGTITFNGTNAYVRVPNATLSTWLPGTDDFTVEWFLKRTGNGTGFPRVFSIGPDTSATLGCSIEGGTAYIWADNGNGSGQWMNGAMPANYNNGTAWCHIALSRISGVTRLYIDGQYKSKSSNVRSINPSIHVGEPMYMGGDGATNWFQGQLTNFRWANTGLYAGSETTITVPSSPLSNIAQTKLLLLGGTIANPVFDATSINTLVNSNTGWSADTPFA